jgi:hypothetical protein
MAGWEAMQQGAPDPFFATTARNVVEVEYMCGCCGARSTFDGVGGEWCAECETSEQLVPRERLYRLVEIDLD